MPNSLSPIREPKIVNRQPEGSGAVEKYEAGLSATWEGLLMVAANLHEQVFTFKSPKGAVETYKVASPRTRVERTPSGGVLVPVDLLPVSKYPLLAVVVGSCVSAEVSRRNDTHGKSAEVVTLSVEMFQREVEGSGEIKEVRYGVADLQMDAELFFEVVAPEIGSRTVQSAIDFVCEHNRKVKSAYKKFIDSLPPLPDPAKQSAEIVAAGFKLALEQLGLEKAQPAKQ